MIDLQNVSKSYGARNILVNAGLRINTGERVGVVGPNGSGKSTVAAIVAGEIDPDAGLVTVPKDATIGYLRQQLPEYHGQTGLLRFAESGPDEIEKIEKEMSLIEGRLGHEPAGQAKQRLIERLGSLQTAFEQNGGYELRYRAEAALTGLGFAGADFSRSLDQFSGGWQMRAALARCLVGGPSILLLDEPSNYLDLPAVEWLQRYLRDYSGTLVLISHERYLLNTLTTVTIEVAGGRVERFSGNYDYYRQERVRRYESRFAARRNQDRKREKAERFVERFRAKASKASQVKSRVKMIERMETVEAAPPVSGRGTMRISTPSRCGQDVLILENIGFAYDDDWILRHLDLRVERGDKLALIGHNGVGKTTLLRLMAGVLKPREGRISIGHNVVQGYQAQDFTENMKPDCTVLETVKAAAPESSEQTARDILGGFGFSGPAVDNRVAVLSGGEKVRLAFARLLVKPPNFLLLDEPTTHLDIAAREMLENALRQYQGAVCMVSHDVTFVEKIATGVVVMEPPGIRRFYGNYAEYRNTINLGREESISSGSAKRTVKEAAGNNGDDRKNRRRQRAVERQAEAGRVRELKTTIARSERRIEQLEEEQIRLLELLARPEKNADFAATNLRLQEIQAELTEQSNSWLRAGEELEKIKP